MIVDQKTELEGVEVKADGQVMFRLGFAQFVDGKQRGEVRWHRSGVEAGGDIDAQFAVVNTHIESMGELPVSAEDIARVKNFISLAWTPAVLAAAEATRLGAVAKKEAEMVAAMEAKEASLDEAIAKKEAKLSELLNA